MLEIRGVSKVYETGGLKHKALDKVSINFRTSEFAAILGPSGSGKTTLLNIIGGLDHYTSGDLKINEVSTKNFRDKDWDAYRNHRIGFVFQAYNLIPHQTVLANVKLALTLSGISKREATKRAKKALTDVGLKEQIYKKPSQLSGGQMQRVAIARALVNNPDILLADEPTGALDSETSIQIMNLLKEIAKDKLVIMVTHNPELANEYATRIINLKDGEIISDTDPYDGKVKTNLDDDTTDKKRRKTKMSFFTALTLSLNNLLTKKGRTVLVAFAGSIGIIGIALILAVSTGFQTYIDDIQRDTLTSYPLAIYKESTNLIGTLLNASMGGEKYDDGKIHESQMLTTMIGDVKTNDLKDFRQYTLNHYNEIADDIRLMEDEYSVEPQIYTIDAADELVRLNPNDLFNSLMGGSTIVNASVFAQMDQSTLENDMDILTGRLPSAYDEVVVILQDENQISDLLTYSLGFHDTEELSKSVTKLLAGESVSIKDEPLVLTLEDLMNVDLRMIYATDTFRYNATYNIYEDMNGDESYMMGLYNDKSVRLKVVGVAKPKNDLLVGSSGVAYLPELVTHIIEKSSDTEIVKKQLENPTMDILSNKEFGSNENNFNLSFSDLVTIDESKLGQAFRSNIDQTAVSAVTSEYMENIANDVDADIVPVQTALEEKLVVLADGLGKNMVGEEDSATFKYDEINETVDAYLTGQDFATMEENYILPQETFREIYGGILKTILQKYAEQYVAGMQQFDPDMTLENAEVPITVELLNGLVGQAVGMAEMSLTFENLAVNIVEVKMKKTILEKVGGLTAYLSSTFASGIGVDQDALIGAFQLRFSEDELSRIITTVFNKKDATLATNLALMGYQALDDPTEVSFYFNSFDGKTRFMKFIDNYNDMVKKYGQDDRIIEYSDTTGLLMSSVKTIVDAVSYVLIAFVSISLVVSSIMIGIITYISVYERTKEIGILRAIGASKRNISSIFNAETFIVGLLSGIFGITLAYLIIPIINLVMGAFTVEIPGELSAFLAPGAAAVLIALSVILTLIGGLIPARAAAKKDPVEALRSE